MQGGDWGIPGARFLKKVEAPEERQLHWLFDLHTQALKCASTHTHMHIHMYTHQKERKINKSTPHVLTCTLLGSPCVPPVDYPISFWNILGELTLACQQISKQLSEEYERIVNPEKATEDTKPVKIKEEPVSDITFPVSEELEADLASGDQSLPIGVLGAQSERFPSNLEVEASPQASSKEQSVFILIRVLSILAVNDILESYSVGEKLACAERKLLGQTELW